MVDAGAQPAIHFGGDNFHEISFDYVIVFIHRSRTLSQTVTYNNNVFLPADTKSIVQTHTSCTTLVEQKRTKQNVLQQRWGLNHRCQAKFLTCEISNITPYVHAQSNIQHIKYAEKTDD